MEHSRAMTLPRGRAVAPPAAGRAAASLCAISFPSRSSALIRRCPSLNPQHSTINFQRSTFFRAFWRGAANWGCENLANQRRSGHFVCPSSRRLAHEPSAPAIFGRRLGALPWRYVAALPQMCQHDCTCQHRWHRTRGWRDCWGSVRRLVVAISYQCGATSEPVRSFQSRTSRVGVGN